MPPWNAHGVADVQALLSEALQILASRCPRLVRTCYWAGTSAIATEELGHRVSFDLDFHSREALADVRPLLAEVQAAFPGRVEVTQPPDEFGSGFQVELGLSGGERVTLEVLSNFEDVPSTDLVPARTVPGVSRVSLERYVADKIQCVAERAEARDLIDLEAVFGARPAMVGLARRALAAQDALLLAERLRSWTLESLRADLSAYPDVEPERALQVRDQLLSWVREDS